jgi:hypothetical protein
MMVLAKIVFKQEWKRKISSQTVRVGNEIDMKLLSLSFRLLNGDSKYSMIKNTNGFYKN